MIEMPLKQMRVAVYQRLKGDLETQGSTIKVWPFVAESETTKPAVMIAQYHGKERDYKGQNMVEMAVTLEILDELDGDDRIADAINAVLASLTRAPLTITGWEETWQVGEAEETELMSWWTGERWILKGVVRYRWLITKVS